MKDTKWTIITGVYFGIAVATKITTLLSLPLFFYVFLVKRDYKELAGFALTALGTFIIVNPFAFILNDKFMFRIFEMFTKEAGLVFDSLDSNPFKYLIALFYVATPLVSIFSLYGKYSVFKKGSVDNKEFHIFLVANVVLYILFFSLQSRRVDRWLLPILPIFISYAAIGLCTFYKKVQKKWVSIVLFTIVFGSYIHFPLLLLQQFQPNTPKSASYLWLKDKVVKGELVLAYTEQGLDPLHKIQYSRVEKIGVYENEAAQLDFPRDPNNYKYVVISSRPMEYHKNPKIIEKYPLYASKWAEFENELLNPSKFILIKEFTLPKPNLIPLSDVFVYEKVM